MRNRLSMAQSYFWALVSASVQILSPVWGKAEDSGLGSKNWVQV